MDALKPLWSLVTLAAFPIGGWYFCIAWYHGWNMFANRSGNPIAYYIPLGFMLDRCLTTKGIEHRRAMLKNLAIAAPFIVVLLLNAIARGG
ncbi:MAG: hypothetical protein HY943_12455 [Gammaproteobacteria bacterium]|nr:hypothetical protein [Gammaproteobacteria bacterium]